MSITLASRFGRRFGRPSEIAAAAAVKALADDAPTNITTPTVPTVPTTPVFWYGELEDAKRLIGRKVIWRVYNAGIRRFDDVYMGTIIEVLDNVYFCAFESITAVLFKSDDGSIHTHSY